MAQVMSLKREGWIDQYRGILFLFVIVYHTFQSPIWLRYFFDFFFLPGFFFLSGYLFRAKGIKNNFLSIANGLLIPFALFSCIISVYTAFSSGNWFAFFDTFYDYFVKGGDGIWFIPCLLIVEVFFSIYMNSVKDEKWRIVIMLILFVTSFFICRTTTFHLPWNVDTAILGATFFLMGNISKSFTIPERLISISLFLFYIVISQFVGYSLYNNVDVDLHNNIVGNPFVYLVLSAIASFSLFAVCKNMPVCWYFRKLGQYTLFAFPFHPFIYRSIMKVFDIVGGGKSYNNNNNCSANYRTSNYFSLFLSRKICSIFNRKVQVHKTPRESNIELLRIISMLFIICGHLIDQNNIFSSLNEMSNLNKLLILFLGNGNRIAVSIFLLIGTWFMVDSKFRASRLILLYLQLIFWTSIVSLTVFLLGFDVPIKKVCLGFFPYLTRSLWFVSCYLVLIALSPFLQQLLRSLSKKSLSLLVTIVFFVIVLQCSIYPFTDTWLDGICYFVFVYLLMGYYKLYIKDGLRVNKYIALSLSIALYIILVFLSLFKNDTSGLSILAAKSYQFMIDYKTLPNLIISFGVFYFFLNSNFGRNRIINTMAKSALTVYIVHQTPAFIPVLWRDILVVDSWRHSYNVAFLIMASTLFVYFFISLLNPLWELVKDKIQQLRLYIVIENRINAYYAM